MGQLRLVKGSSLIKSNRLQTSDLLHLLSPQAFAAGVGNWVADEVLYQVNSLSWTKSTSAWKEEKCATFHRSFHA